MATFLQVISIADDIDGSGRTFYNQKSYFHLQQSCYMVDPLAEVVLLLQPGAPSSKIVSGAGRWSVRREDYGQPFFCVILDGSSRLAVDGHAPIILQEGDFVLITSRCQASNRRHRITSIPRPSPCFMAR
jgi:hypothetical protein